MILFNHQFYLFRTYNLFQLQNWKRRWLNLFSSGNCSKQTNARVKIGNTVQRNRKNTPLLV